jgi:hypothetical protein
MMSKSDYALQILMDFIIATEEYTAGRLSREDAELIVQSALEDARELVFPRPCLVHRIYLN